VEGGLVGSGLVRLAINVLLVKMHGVLGIDEGETCHAGLGGYGG